MGIEDRIASQLAAVDGVVAVVLGGSTARGLADQSSDIDLGIYYSRQKPLDIEGIRQVVRAIDDRGELATATDIGEWGQWINGGAWLQVERRHVDFLYRDLDLVSKVIDDCTSGRVSCDYQPGHPHGFHNHMLMAEVHLCRVLRDDSGTLSRLKSFTIPYPPRLKTALIQKYLWEASFALNTAKKPAKRGDIYYVVGCLFRSIACLVQVLYALNERYFINEKRSIAETSNFPICPGDFDTTVSMIIGAADKDPERLEESLKSLEKLAGAVGELVAQ